MRIAIRIFLLLVFGAAFVAAGILSCRGSSDYVSAGIVLPKLFGQKSHMALRLGVSAGQYQVSLVRSAVHNGTSWTYYAPDAKWVSVDVVPLSYLSGPSLGEGARFGEFGVGHRHLDRRMWRRIDSTDDYTPSSDRYAFFAPWWFVMLMTGLPTGYLAMTFRPARVPPTQCRGCGYDLRAGHERCPECGAASHVGIGASNANHAIPAPSGQR